MTMTFHFEGMMKVGNAITLSAHPNHTPEWYAARNSGIGGSEAAVVLGHKPFNKTRLDLWKQKTGADAGAFAGNVATRYGTQIEPYLLDRLLWDFGYSARECDAQLVHKTHQFMRCNLDGIIMDDADVIGIVEIKSSSGTLAGDQPHEYHMPQIQHNLAVTGLPFCIYVFHTVPIEREHALAIPEQFIAPEQHDAYWRYLATAGDIKVIRVERDDDYIAHLIRHEAEFWACVESGTEPPELMPSDEIEVADETLSELLRAYSVAQSKANEYKAPLELEKHRTELSNQIRLRCDVIAGNAGAKKIHTADGSITWNSRGYWQPRPAPVAAPKNDNNQAPF
jgi:putative phage-type endonuclease